MRNMHRPEHFNNRFPFDGLRHLNRFPRGFQRGRFFRGKLPSQFQDRHVNPDETDDDFMPHDHGRFGPEGPGRNFNPNGHYGSEGPGRNFNPNGHYGSEGPGRNFNPNGHYGSERPSRNFNPNERSEHFGANRFQRGFRFNTPSRIIRPGGPPRDVRPPPNFRDYRPDAPSQGPRSVGPHSMQAPFNTNQPAIRQGHPGPPPRHIGPPAPSGERGIAPSQFGPPLLNSQFPPPIGPLLTHTIRQPAQMGHLMVPIQNVQIRPPMAPPPTPMVPQPDPINPAMLAVRPPPILFNPVSGYVQPQLQTAHLQITRPHMPQSLGPMPRPIGPTGLQQFSQPVHSLHPKSSGNENTASSKLNPDPVLAAHSKSDIRLSDENILVPPGVSPDQSEVMRSPESISSPLKKSSDVPKSDFVNVASLEKGMTTVLPNQSQISNFEIKSEGKKVLINPHFRGSVQPPAVGVNYLPGPESYQATAQIQSGTISETEFNRLTDQFINEQRKCLEKVKNQSDEDFFQKTQRFIDNISKESSKDSERDRYRERERDRERTNRSKLEKLQRAQEKFIQENKAQLSSVKRRRDSPSRGVSPKRQRTPEEQVDPEEREYRARLREQAEMRQRVLLVKERRRKRDAASKVLTQPETGFDHGDNQGVSKQYSEKDMGKSSNNTIPPHQTYESKPMDSSNVRRGVESGQQREMYAREDDKQSRYRSERREDDYYGGRSDAYRQEDAKNFRQDSHFYKNTEQIAYKASVPQDFGDSMKSKSHRDEKRDTYDNYDANYYRVDDRAYESEGKAGYRVDERRDGTRMESSYRDDSRTNYRMDDRRDLTGYNQDERREVLNYRSDDIRDPQNYKQEDRRDPQSYKQDDRRDFQGYKQDDRRDVQGYKQDERRDTQSYKQDDRRDPQNYKQDDRRDLQSYKQDDRRDPQSYKQEDRRDPQSYKQEDRRDPQSYKQEDRRDPQSYKQEDRRDLQSYKQEDRRDVLEYRQEEKYDERSYRLEGGSAMAHYEKSYSYKPEDRNYYRTENRKDVQRPVEKRDANDYRTEEGRDSSYYRVDERRDTLKSKTDDRKDMPGYRPDEKKDVINYRTDEKKKSPGSRNDNYSFKTVERSDQYVDDRAYRSDDKYRQDEKFDQQGSYKIDDKKDRREYQNYERRDRFDEKRVNDERKATSKTEDKKISEVKSTSEEVRKIDRKTPEKCPPKNSKIKDSKVSQKTVDNKVIGKPADIKATSVKSLNEKSNTDKAKYEEDLLLQDYEPTLDEMLEDDTLRLNPEDEDLLLSDNESHTPPPVSRPKTNLPAKNSSDESVQVPKEGNTRSDTRSLTPPRPASGIKRSQPTDSKSNTDLRTKLARNTPPSTEVQQPSGKQPSMISKEKKKIVYDIRDTKGEPAEKGLSKESGNKWRSTFTEQKLEKSAPIAARAISAALGRDSAPKRTVIASSQQNIESSSDAVNKRNTNTSTNSGRRVLVGKTDTTGGQQSNRTVVLPKRQPVVIVEKDDDPDNDEPKAKKGKDQKVATAFISGLPPGMTEIRLLSLCGPEVEQVTLSATERDSATARFLSADACDRFIRRFDGRIVAACSLRVRKST